MGVSWFMGGKKSIQIYPGVYDGGNLKEKDEKETWKPAREEAQLIWQRTEMEN